MFYIKKFSDSILFGLSICILISESLQQISSQKIPAGALKFAADLVDIISTHNLGQNIVFSPVSIQFSLGVLFFGATGDTAEELRQAAKIEDGVSLEIISNFNDRLYAYAKSPVSPVLKIANRIFVSNASQVSETFRMIALNFFETSIVETDFRNPINASENINNFVAQLTDTYIDKIIAEADVASTATIAIFSVAAFDGNWKYPFDPQHTTREVFYLADKQEKDVEFLTQIGQFTFADVAQLKARIICLPYNNSDLSMVIVLPNRICDLFLLEKKLSKIDWVEITRQFEKQVIEIKLPKFSIESEFDLSETMDKLGIKTAFTSNATFGEISTKPMHLSLIKHKAHIVFNERSTAASAGTKHILSRSELIKFHINRPFVFAITNGNAIFFQGHVMDPTL